MPLTGKQRRYLRGLAHHLNPVVLTGSAGLTEAIIDKVVTELEHHELIKVRIGDGAINAREAGQPLSESSKAELVQVIGRIVVLYKRRPKKPEIRLPKE